MGLFARRTFLPLRAASTHCPGLHNPIRNTTRPALFSTTQRTHSDSTTQPQGTAQNSAKATPKESKATAESPSQQPKKKTMAELDEELKLKMEGISGDGGSSGVEYEGGKAEGLKRGVKDNMFRVI